MRDRPSPALSASPVSAFLEDVWASVTNLSVAGWGTGLDPAVSALVYRAPPIPQVPLHHVSRSHGLSLSLANLSETPDGDQRTVKQTKYPNRIGRTSLHDDTLAHWAAPKQRLD